MENSGFTMVEINKAATSRKTAIAIRTFFDSNSSNMGLEHYGQSLFDGVKHFEQLACLEQNGVIRYVTGLNEFAPGFSATVLPARRATLLQSPSINESNV